MRNRQFIILSGLILLHLYWTSPEKPLPALVLAGICIMASPFVETKKDNK